MRSRTPSLSSSRAATMPRPRSSGGGKSPPSIIHRKSKASSCVSAGSDTNAPITTLLPPLGPASPLPSVSAARRVAKSGASAGRISASASAAGVSERARAARSWSARSSTAVARAFLAPSFHSMRGAPPNHCGSAAGAAVASRAAAATRNCTSGSVVAAAAPHLDCTSAAAPTSAARCSPGSAPDATSAHASARARAAAPPALRSPFASRSAPTRYSVSVLTHRCTQGAPPAAADSAAAAAHSISADAWSRARSRLCTSSAAFSVLPPLASAPAPPLPPAVALAAALARGKCFEQRSAASPSAAGSPEPASLAQPSAARATRSACWSVRTLPAPGPAAGMYSL
mmetsp:Transcript_13912/g.58040  ORF Transcript_13912/g.58040 Transcript_13912/m.58040 type:complete len:343 (+) Transcript_13912:1327-2355(+)